MTLFMRAGDRAELREPTSGCREQASRRKTLNAFECAAGCRSGREQGIRRGRVGAGVDATGKAVDALNATVTVQRWRGRALLHVSQVSKVFFKAKLLTIALKHIDGPGCSIEVSCKFEQALGLVGSGVSLARLLGQIELVTILATIAAY